MKTGIALIETHAHLDSPRFAGDREQVIARAVERGVVQMITVGTSVESSRAAIALAEQYEPVYATVGVHPHDSAGFSPQSLEELASLANHPKVVAVGEIGIDHYRDYAPRENQLAAFQMQLALANEIGKPVVVHIRDREGARGAYETVMANLTVWMEERVGETEGPPGVLHCYSGGLDTARRGLDLGFLLGVDGPVTYPNARDLRALVAQLPLERLLLETDCPYLAPQPRRGQRNEPAFLPYIAEKLAQVHGVPLAEVVRRTTASARRLFGLPSTSEPRPVGTR
jgi:TatD DNase family protein